MQINLERRPIVCLANGSFYEGGFISADKALTMRSGLTGFIEGLLANASTVRLPSQPKELESRGEGHFHLAPEIFLQTGGTTRFIFPHEELDLLPGQVLIVPPRLLHAERVLVNRQNEVFSNVVVYADGTALTCHLAHELESGMPGVHHLEARHHTHAPRIHDWLTDAARLGWEADTQSFSELSQRKEKPKAIQLRALVATACAGVLRILDDAAFNATPEPALVSRARIWVQNRIGDHQLSVAWLAEQAGCTADYLSHLFSQATGEHLVAYINRQRMQRAASLLAETKLAGKEIAWVCGFSTPSYFIQMFRAHYGITPNKWRAKRNNDIEDIA